MNIGPVIKPASGHNGYCGPGALSIICRIDTAQAAQRLREVSGKRAIKFVRDFHMHRVLTKLGYRPQPLTYPEPITLAGWLKANPLSKRGANVYLITAGHHYVTIQGRRGGCNQTGGPVALKDIKKRRAIVTSVTLVHPKKAAPVVQRVPGVAPAAPAKLQPLKTVAAAEAALAKAKVAADAALARLRAEELRLSATRKWVADERVRTARNTLARDRRKAKILAMQWGIKSTPSATRRATSTTGCCRRTASTRTAPSPVARTPATGATSAATGARCWSLSRPTSRTSPS